VIEDIVPFVRQQADRLKKVGIDQAKTEIELILCHLLNCERLQLYMYGGEQLDESHLNRFEQIIQHRLTRHPLQFILHEAWFYGRKFFVNESVMAPTPETELLCEQAVALVKQKKLVNPKMLDVGVGSGVISVTMAAELGYGSVVALDISEEALEVARRNVAEYGLAERIELRRSDYFSAVRPDEKFDLIMSNPPYITDGDYVTLDPEVLADPKIAMTAGEDGLDAIRVILRDAPDFLAPGGRIMFEIGLGQAEAVADLTGDDDRYRSLVVIKDLNQRDRLIVLECD